jgi:hypothetical protein
MILSLENMKILKMLLEKKPDLTIKNKKGQTPIDITSSKTIISLFWHYLTAAAEANNAATVEENKTPAPAKPVPRVASAAPALSAPKVQPQKKIQTKIVVNDVKTKGGSSSTKQRGELTGSDTLSAVAKMNNL